MTRVSCDQVKHTDETQNNEADALRSWREARDAIYYYNANRLPSNYRPASETEKALYDSLKMLELQCRERVDLLEALKQSRRESEKDDKADPRRRLGAARGKSTESLPAEQSGSAWLGDNSIPPMQYHDLPTPSPALPPRPSIQASRSSDTTMKDRAASVPNALSGSTLLLPVPSKQTSRSPSPDAGRKTMRTTLRSGKGFRSSRPQTQPRRQAPMKAAGMAWDIHPRVQPTTSRPDSDPTIEARLSATAARRSLDANSASDSRTNSIVRMPDPNDYIPASHWCEPSDQRSSPVSVNQSMSNLNIRSPPLSHDDLEVPPPPPPHASSSPTIAKARTRSPPRLPKAPEISYRREYPSQASKLPSSVTNNLLDKAYPRASSGITRKPVNSTTASPVQDNARTALPDTTDSEEDTAKKPSRRPQASRKESSSASKPITPPSTSPDNSSEENEIPDSPEVAFEKRSKYILKHLPRGIDPLAAANILNEVVVRGDEVHWDDVAGLELAKTALKEAVVYPFLRPDLFMGLREPARGMLLFGPPGTGKTMLARAVATESKSTFFSISASSLTSKWHGESEKLVRALFAIAKVMSPSIIFVDEIDSLLSKRGEGSEHEASRRSKTEFLIQWSDLQRAAAGKEKESDKLLGDPTRVLVLAATNCPWDIDDAARRRFVRRQYIPLPEMETREKQLRTLLGHQKHDLREPDIMWLVAATDGESLFPSLAFCCVLQKHRTDGRYRLLWLRHHGFGKRRSDGTIA